MLEEELRTYNKLIDELITGGAALPILIASYTVGGSCLVYGLSNAAEGGQDWYYGANNNITDEAFNPIRDTIFQGNEESYTLWGNANMIAAAVIMPFNKGLQAVSQAGNAATAGQKAATVLRVMGTEFGKDTVNDMLSTGVGYGAAKLTGSEEVGMAAGVLSSFFFGKGLDDIDESLDLSGVKRLKGVTSTNNRLDDIDMPTVKQTDSSNRPKLINTSKLDSKSTIAFERST